VRKKNVLATLMQSFAITCLVTLLWYVIGYTLAFTPGTPYVGGLSRLFMNGVIYIKDCCGAAATKDTPAVDAVIGKVSVSHLGVTIPETVYSMFQLTFAIITPALICGAFAERMKSPRCSGSWRFGRSSSTHPSRIGCGNGRLGRNGGRARLRRRHRGAHQTRDRRARLRVGSGQACRLQQRAHGAPQLVLR